MIRSCVHLIILSSILSFSAQGQEKDLGFFVQQGLANSPLLKDLSNQLRTNSYDSALARASFQPQVNFNASAMYAPVVNGYGYSEPITNGQQFLMQIGAGQAIFNSKARKSEYQKIGIESLGIASAGKISALDLKNAIIAQYLAVYGLYNESVIKGELITSSNEEERILKELVNKGLYKQNDYLSFLLELQTLTFDLTDLEIQYRKELSNLKLLCGMNDTIGYHLKAPELTPLPVSGYANSFFFQRFRIDSLKLENEKAIVGNHYKPQVNWFTDAGLVNNEPRYLYKNFGVSLGISLSLPVYDGNRRKLSYEKLKVSEQTRTFYRDFFMSQYEQQISQLNKELSLTMAQFPRLEQQRQMADELIRQDKLLMNTGNISVTDYMLALKNVILVRKNFNQYQVRMWQIINEINYWREK
jgi:outer membrane protein TolC